jgi:hypothetical protein
MTSVPVGSASYLTKEKVVNRSPVQVFTLSTLLAGGFMWGSPKAFAIGFPLIGRILSEVGT